MAKPALRQKAIALRLQGYTYSQIKQKLHLQKSTLSDWLRNLPLTIGQLELLGKNKLNSKNVRIEKYRQTVQNRQIARYKKVFSEQSKLLLPLSKKELLIAGLFLYWGEGSKQKGSANISNTSPQVMQFSKYWMVNALDVPVKKLRIRLHLYSDMDLEKHIGFWSNLLDIPRDQFKISIKNSTRAGLSYKSYGHGTCNLMCFDTTLSEKIAMSIKAIAEFCGAKSDLYWYN